MERIRVFENRELEASDRIMRHVSRGGVAVLEGNWDRVMRLYTWLRSRQTDRGALGRLMLRAEGDALAGVTPEQRLPLLRQVAGDQAVPHGPGYLVPLEIILKGQQALTELHPVEALGESLVVHNNVLVPRCQPLLHLMKAAIVEAAAHQPDGLAVLDMGCGSGVCAFLAACTLPAATVTATDHLPEAVATTRYNAERLEALGRLRAGAVLTAEPGDLFEHLAGRRFDLIIFNAPWVNAPARNKLETVLNDGGQRTVQRFLQAAPVHLTAHGRVVLGYANHSGDQAITNLESFIKDAGLIVLKRHTDRIKTHRRRRSWERIYAYELALVGSKTVD